MSRRAVSIIVGCLVVVATVVAGAAWKSRSGGEAEPQRMRTPVKAFIGKPRVVYPDNVYDFGVMNPGDKQTRKFTVRNEGEGDLKLSLGKTTCKCTLANLDEETIPPGGSTEITLEWHTEEAQFRFRQAAVINTNDPRQPMFELAVEGSVRTKLATLPSEVYFAEVPKNTGRTTDVLLYSQAFDRLEITSIESTLPAVTATLATEPTTDAAAAPQESRYLRRLKITKAPDSKPGSFQGVVRLHYVGSYHGGPEEKGTFELPFGGDTVGDLSIHGRSVVGTLLNLGTVERSRGTKQRAYVHVRGNSPPVSFSLHRATPDFLKVDFGKPERLSPTIMRYPIEVSVPPGASEVNLLGEETGRGEVVLTTTHADHPQVRFQVSLAILNDLPARTP